MKVKQNKRGWCYQVKVALFFFLTSSNFLSYAQIPTGYYSAAENKSGYELKTALHNIIENGHQTRGYGAIWDFYTNYSLDNYYEKDGTILDIYSENPLAADPYNFVKSTNQCGNFVSEGDCYNREHTFPKSWFGGSIDPMYCDVNHIMATDGKVNGMRNNYPYGEVGGATYTSANGSKLGSGASDLGYSGTVFEPIDEFKGDVARAWLYMATRYEDKVVSWNNNTGAADVLDGTSDHVYKTWVVNMLLKWHKNDPVSQREIDRNNGTYEFQGNRNPFIDHPEYVESIWSSDDNGGGSGGGGSNNGDATVTVAERMADFGYLIHNGRTIQYFNIEASNLTTAITIVTPEYFSVSTSGDLDSFTNQIELEPSGNGAINTTIYILFEPGSDNTNYDIDDAIRLTSSEFDTVSIRITATSDNVISGIEDGLDAAVDIYPNPAVNNLYLKGVSRVDYITVYTVTGLPFKLLDAASSYDCRNWPRGLFILNAVMKDGSRKAFKVQIQ